MVAPHVAAAFAEHLRVGATALRRGRFQEAAAALEAALALAPAEPEALRWRGEIARAQGDDALAETCWRRSLEALEAQPTVWNNLGNLLARTGRPDEALAAFARAIAHHGRYPEAHYNRARVLQRLGRNTEAAVALQQALALPGGPRDAMLQLAALLHEGAGRLDEALATLDRALELAPTKPALHHNRGVLLQRLSRPAEALQAHERALFEHQRALLEHQRALLEHQRAHAHTPAHALPQPQGAQATPGAQPAQASGSADADMHYNHGNTLQALGRGEEALAAYRRALSANPRHGLALYDLARLRWRLGDDAFDEELRVLEARAAASPLGPGLRGHLLARAERHAEAEAAFGEALRRDPRAAGFHDGLGRVLSRQGRHEAALASHERAVALAPRDADLHAHHAAALLAAGRAEAALAAAERACALNPHDQHAWAQRGLAWRLLGDARAAWLDNVERLVDVHDLPTPAGFADMASFNHALARELLALHHDRREPVDQTLRHGTQTLGNLFDQGHPLVDALKARIAEAVTKHIAALPPHDAAHPLLGRVGSEGASAARNGARWRFTDSWSSRLVRRGFHTSHVHPHGWMSSAYYVALPACVHDASAGHAGWLQLGQPDRDLGLAPTRRVLPRVGRLVMFPSYLWHGTLPFDDEGMRLTLAFDVVPA